MAFIHRAVVLQRWLIQQVSLYLPDTRIGFQTAKFSLDTISYKVGDADINWTARDRIDVLPSSPERGEEWRSG